LLFGSELLRELRGDVLSIVAIYMRGCPRVEELAFYSNRFVLRGTHVDNIIFAVDGKLDR